MAPLFFVHEVNGTVAYVRELMTRLPAQLPVYGLDAIGLQADVPAPATIEEIAAGHIACMRQVQAAGPYRIAGYSLGGVIAYEIAAQLIGADQEVEFVGMIDSENVAATQPQYQGDDQVERSEQQRDIDMLLRLIPLDSVERGDMERLAQAGDLDMMLASCLRHRPLGAEMDAASLRRHLSLMRKFKEALGRYLPRAIPVRVSLFTAGEPVRQDASLGWGSLLGERVEIVPIGGTHQSIVSAAHVAQLGRAMTDALQRGAGVQDVAERRHVARIAIQADAANSTVLFCVPGAGASAVAFFDLASALGEDVSVHAFQARGLCGALVPHVDVVAAACAYVRELQLVQPAGPYRLLGHSFGGWIAYEMACQLQAQGQQVALLAVLDSRVPGAPAQPRPTRVEALMKLAGVFELKHGKSIGIGASELAALGPRAQLALMHERLVSAGVFSARTPLVVLAGIASVYEANLCTTFAPEVLFDGRLHVMICSERGALATTGHAMSSGWAAWSSETQVSQVHGNHLTMLESPHVQALADRLMSIMLANVG